MATRSQTARSNQSTTQPALKCEKCNREYKTKSGLAKHIKTCGDNDRTKCLYCSFTCNSYTGLRSHEVRAHKELLNESEQQGRTETETLILMAKTEAGIPRGQHVYKELIAVTGLTRDKIRHRRDKPLYKEYLARAIKEREALSQSQDLMNVTVVLETSELTPASPNSPIGMQRTTRSQPPPRIAGLCPAQEPGPSSAPDHRQDNEATKTRETEPPNNPETGSTIVDSPTDRENPRVATPTKDR